MSIQNSRQVGDVKVMLKTGVDGNGIASIEKTGTSGLVDTYTITFTSGSKTTFTVTNGKGISSIAKTGTSGLVDTYTITFNDGTTSTFTVTNGNGISNIAKTGTSGLVDTYTITYTDGTTSTFQVTNGADTNAQIAERVSNPAQRRYNIGEYVILSDTLYKVTAPIASGANFVVDTNITATQVMDEVFPCDANAVLGAHQLLDPDFKMVYSGGASATNDRGVITINGTQTQQTNFEIKARTLSYPHMYLPKGTYTFDCAGCDYVYVGTSYNGSYSEFGAGERVTFTITDDTNSDYKLADGSVLVGLWLQIPTGTYNNKKLYPLLTLATDKNRKFGYYTETNEQLTQNKMSYKAHGMLGAKNLYRYDEVKNNVVIASVKAGVPYKFTCDNAGTTGVLLKVGTSEGAVLAETNNAVSTPKINLEFTPSQDCDVFMNGYCSGGTFIGNISNIMLCLAEDNDPTYYPHAMTNLEITNPTFTEASTRANIASGELLTTILGKIKKFFTDLKTVAFTGAYNDLSGKPELKAVATSGSYNDLSDAPTVYSPTVYSAGEQLIGKWLNGDNLYSITIAEKQSATQSDVTNKTRKYIYASSMPFDASDIRWIHDAFIITQLQGTVGYVYPFMQNYYVEEVNLTNAISYVPLQVFTDYYFVFTIFYTKH